MVRSTFSVKKKKSEMIVCSISKKKEIPSLPDGGTDHFLWVDFLHKCTYEKVPHTNLGCSTLLLVS